MPPSPTHTAPFLSLTEHFYRHTERYHLPLPRPTTVVIVSLKYYSCVLNSTSQASPTWAASYLLFLYDFNLKFVSISTHTFEHYFVNCFLSVHLAQIRTADKTVECQRWVYQFHPRRTLASVPLVTSTFTGWCCRLRGPYNSYTSVII